jgi:hypothetical protein
MHGICRSSFPFLKIALWITQVNCVECDMAPQQDCKDMYVQKIKIIICPNTTKFYSLYRTTRFVLSQVILRFTIGL